MHDERPQDPPTGMPEGEPEETPLGVPEADPDGAERRPGAGSMPGIPTEGEPPAAS